MYPSGLAIYPQVTPPKVGCLEESIDVLLLFNKTVSKYSGAILCFGSPVF